MSDRIRMTGFVSAECEARTLGDLRALVKWCDEYGVDDRAGLDWGMGILFVDLTGDRAVPAEWIECGDHVPPNTKYDLIISTHYHGPETPEEAREEAYEKSMREQLRTASEQMRKRWDKPWFFDDAAADRYSDEARPE